MFLTTVSLLVLLCLSQIKNMSTDMSSGLCGCRLLFWRDPPEVWCWMLRTWPPRTVCLSIPKQVALARQDQAVRTPCELSGAELNRTEPNWAEPSRTAQRSPSVPRSVSQAGDSVISRDSAAVCPSGWRLRAARGGGSARCWFWCCAAPLLRDTPRGWVNTPRYTHKHTRARAHTHTHTGDQVMGQMLLLISNWWV